MRVILCATVAALALTACQKQAEAPPPADETVATADAKMPAPTEAALGDLKGTSWEFIDPKSKKAMQESIDEQGNYITQSGAEHIDHGTYVDKDGKACFTSAMTKEGESCWTGTKIEVGQSGVATSDKGMELPIKRVEYKPLTM